jgi:peptidoglycan/xylan/chitin deacetylase (PgdA/CDA1 family)
MNILLTFDNLGEAYDLFRFGFAGGASADGVYAVRRGVPRLLEMLARRGLHATFFVEGWGAAKYPGLVREIVAAGHEVGAHGWLHENWDALAPDDERELVARMTDAIGTALGTAPAGFRAPAARISPRTLSHLADAGYRYDSSFLDEDVPYRLAVAAGDTRTLLELPMNPVLGDTPFYAQPGGLRSPADVMNLWWEELSGLAASAGYACITTHPRHSGRPARSQALEGLVERLQSGAVGDVRFLRCAEAVDRYAASADTPSYPAPETTPKG